MRGEKEDERKGKRKKGGRKEGVSLFRYPLLT